MIKLGEKIRTLRKQRNISQEVLANYLGVSFQSVSKWETDATMPDVTLIPAIASFFEVSIDELFDYNCMEAEKKVGEICDEAYKYRVSDPAKSEEILRDGLKQFPGNDMILVNLLHVIESDEETIKICKSLIETTRDDATKYSAYLFMAHSYKSLGEYTLMKETVEKIPEIYFTKLSVAADFYEGEDAYEPACKSESLSLENLLWACRSLAKCYVGRGNIEKAQKQLEMAIKIIEVVIDNDGTEYVKNLRKIYTGFLSELEINPANL